MRLMKDPGTGRQQFNKCRSHEGIAGVSGPREKCLVGLEDPPVRMDREVSAGCTLIENFRVTDEQTLVDCSGVLFAVDRTAPPVSLRIREWLP